MTQALSLHSLERLLEQFQIARAAGLFARGFNPFLLQRVFGRAIGFVKHAEDAWERERRQLVRGQFIRHVMS